MDLGCRHGAVIYFAQFAGYRSVSGANISSEQVAEAKRLGIGNICHGNLFAHFKNLLYESQDVIVAFDAIEHFTKEALTPIVDQVRRILRKDDKWIIHTANTESPFGNRMLC